MSVDQTISDTVKEFDKVIIHLQDEFSRLQVGRANPALVENVHVDMYGSVQPMKAVATITVPEPRTIMIQPWDKAALGPIERGIVGSGIGLNPVNDGVVIRINIPTLTEERRRDLTKLVKQIAEQGHISVRNFRQDAHNKFKQMKSDGDITEDDLHGAEKKLQERVDDVNKKIDDLAKIKEQDVMTV